MLTIIGLGNVGVSYQYSRHNVGFMLLDGVVEGRFLSDIVFNGQGRKIPGKNKYKVKNRFNKTTGPFESIECTLHEKKILLIKPSTFMNNSGKALSYIVNRGIVKDLSEILVIVDDVDINLGIIRLRAKGSSGGHKGLQSVIDHLNTGEFARLRVGIGQQSKNMDLKDYVLDTFSKKEMSLVENSLIDAGAIVDAWISGGYENAQRMMSRLYCF